MWNLHGGVDDLKCLVKRESGEICLHWIITPKKRCRCACAELEENELRRGIAGGLGGRWK